MNQRDIDRRKSRVSKDFNATLQSIIRSLSQEEIKIIDAFGSSEEKKDFYVTFNDENASEDVTLERRKSIYRNKSFNTYELVVDQRLSTRDSLNSKELETLAPKIYTRPIRISTESSVESGKSQKPKSKVSKASKYLQRFFPSFDYLKIPFERTTVTSLPYQLHIDIENKRKVSIQVTEFYTVDYVKSKIFKKENIVFEKQALFHKGERLEGTSLLYSYGINSSSRIELKFSEQISIICVFNQARVSLTVYTSISVLKFKTMICSRISVDPNDIEVQYKDAILEDIKELFIYNITDGSEIIIIIITEIRETKKEQGDQTVDKFFKMTDNLTKCKCRQLRIDVMAEIMRIIIDRPRIDTEIRKNREFLEEFDKSRNYHHINCFKLSSPSAKDRNSSHCSSFSELASTSFSGSDSSLKSVVFAENKRVERHASLIIEERYIKLIAECKDFKTFKHLLKDKIGTKCSLRSVALLYKYTRVTVRFLGINENENSPEVNRILDFTKLYFEKYFKKYIVEKGGLDALTLSGSDVD